MFRNWTIIFSRWFSFVVLGFEIGLFYKCGGCYKMKSEIERNEPIWNELECWKGIEIGKNTNDELIWTVNTKIFDSINPSFACFVSDLRYWFPFFYLVFSFIYFLLHQILNIWFTYHFFPKPLTIEILTFSPFFTSIFEWIPYPNLY